MECSRTKWLQYLLWALPFYSTWSWRWKTLKTLQILQLSANCRYKENETISSFWNAQCLFKLLVIYLTVLSVAHSMCIALISRMISERLERLWKEAFVSYRHLPRRVKENHQNIFWGWPFPGPKFEPGMSWIWDRLVRLVTAGLSNRILKINLSLRPALVQFVDSTNNISIYSLFIKKTYFTSSKLYHSKITNIYFQGLYKNQFTM